MSVSGKFLTGMIGAVPIAGLYGWTVRESYDKLDSITAADAGANRKDAGVGTAEISLKLVMDITTGNYTAVRAGQDITNLNLFRNAADATPAFTFPLFRVFDSDQGAEIRGRVEVTASGENIGAYTASNV